MLEKVDIFLLSSMETELGSMWNSTCKSHLAMQLTNVQIMFPVVDLGAEVSSTFSSISTSGELYQCKILKNSFPQEEKYARIDLNLVFTISTRITAFAQSSPNISRTIHISSHYQLVGKAERNTTTFHV